MVNNTSGTETDGVLKYFMATAIKWVNHTFICISVEEGGTKNEWSNETDLVCFRTYSKGIGENIIRLKRISYTFHWNFVPNCRFFG